MESMKKSYRDLFIWQASVDLATHVIAVTHEFPVQQRYVLVEQMQRAAISVPSNIAEGKGRLSQRELRRYVGVARGSLYELDTQIEIASRVGFLDEQHRDDLNARLVTIGCGINNFLKCIKT